MCPMTMGGVPKAEGGGAREDAQMTSACAQKVPTAEIYGLVEERAAQHLVTGGTCPLQRKPRE